MTSYAFAIVDLQLSLQQQESGRNQLESQRRDGYNETETMQLLSQTHLQSPGSAKPHDMHSAYWNTYMKAGEAQQGVYMFPPQHNSNYQVGLQILHHATYNIPLIISNKNVWYFK